MCKFKKNKEDKKEYAQGHDHPSGFAWTGEYSFEKPEIEEVFETVFCSQMRPHSIPPILAELPVLQVPADRSQADEKYEKGENEREEIHISLFESGLVLK